MKRIAVLGAGRIGAEVARDLSHAFDVTSFDLDADLLARRLSGSAVRTVAADVGTAEAVRRAVRSFDLVIGALPGHLGHRALEAAIEAGKDVVDIAFSPEDAFALDGRARERGVTAVVDMGVAPGMSNLFLGRAVEEMLAVERFECLVGGLPVVRSRPFEYKAPFSPVDVIEEYVRPARVVRDGKLEVRPALSEVEPVEFEGIGTLEAFLTDGLRSLLRLPVRWMQEKTLRYPGHAGLMIALREAGLFGVEPVEVDGKRVRPRDVVSALLFPRWTYQPGESDLTAFRVTIEGISRASEPVTVGWDLLDRADAERGVQSMARTTGYACAAVATLLAEGRIRGPGVFGPEHVGADASCFEAVLRYQAERGVVYRRRPA